MFDAVLGAQGGELCFQDVPEAVVQVMFGYFELICEAFQRKIQLQKGFFFLHPAYHSFSECIEWLIFHFLGGIISFLPADINGGCCPDVRIQCVLFDQAIVFSSLPCKWIFRDAIEDLREDDHHQGHGNQADTNEIKCLVLVDIRTVKIRAAVIRDQCPEIVDAGEQDKNRERQQPSEDEAGLSERSVSMKFPSLMETQEDEQADDRIGYLQYRSHQEVDFLRNQPVDFHTLHLTDVVDDQIGYR